MVTVETIRQHIMCTLSLKKEHVPNADEVE